MKLWGGRFQKKAAQLLDDFNSSISFDQSLYRYDILGSIAHVRMLGQTGIITLEEAAQIIGGLQELLTEIEAGQVQFLIEAEDIHMNIETLLIKKVGEVGKKMHTGRSRNDQVALDTRMYAKEKIKQTRTLLLNLLQTLVDLAEKHVDTIMPGYTHLQIAQPITLGHHLMAYVEMFKRDVERLEDCGQRVDVMPLGSGALAGTTFPLDREMVAQELGFAKVSANSLDSVSDRDYVIELLGAFSLVMMHLSRFCEEIIFWASQEWAFVEIDDAYSTGSSIMPQKKNPDVAELIRGKTGRVYGDLFTLLTVMKGLPLAYNKDLQEDKEAFFDGVETVQKCVLIFTSLLATLAFQQKRMREVAGKGFSNATDLADYFVQKGLSFRDAHQRVGNLVSYCLQEGKTLEALTFEEFRKGSGGNLPPFDEEIYTVLELENVVKRRRTYGGTAPEQVREAIKRAKQYLVEAYEKSEDEGI